MRTDRGPYCINWAAISISLPRRSNGSEIQQQHKKKSCIMYFQIMMFVLCISYRCTYSWSTTPLRVYMAKQLLKDRQPVTAVAKPLVAWQRPWGPWPANAGGVRVHGGPKKYPKIQKLWCWRGKPKYFGARGKAHVSDYSDSLWWVRKVKDILWRS